MHGFVHAPGTRRLRFSRHVLRGFTICSISPPSTRKLQSTRIYESELPYREPCGSASSSEEAYLSTLIEEIYASKRAYAAYPREALKSVYLGGGTPSLTSPSGMERLLYHIDSVFGIDSDAEITCEMDPATFDVEKASAYRRMGVNRASVGAQSFDDSHLEACGRIHRSVDIYQSLASLREAGFDNVSLDLISGLPGQTLKTWGASLEAAIGLEPSHISSYDLELEEGTPFGNRFRIGVSPLPSEDHAADMQTMAHDRLTGAGWEHYELGSFARNANLRSQHNLNYWRGDQFFGFGLGATSLVFGPEREVSQGTFRFDRPRGMTAWQDYVRQLEVASRPDSSILYPNSSARSKLDEFQEFVMNGLRLFEGVEFSRIEKLFGKSLCHQLISIYEKSGLRDLGLACLDFTDGGEPQRLRITVEGAKFETSVLAALLFSVDWKL